MTPALLLTLLLAVSAEAPQEPPVPDQADLINTLLGGLLGFRDVSGTELQKEVAEVGGVPFRADVPLDFMDRPGLARYLKEVLDSEYPESKAQADRRTLLAFDLLPADTDLRALRARLLEDNIAGFYDERPGKKRLYAVSADRSLTPANQIILAHELRHALQDQYAEVHGLLPDSVGDFDDRRMALLSLLEGDATLVMERFVVRRIPGAEGRAQDLGSLALPTPELPGAPPVLQDQLVLPYLVGRDFVRALWQQGGWRAVQSAWTHPPRSTEQVLHPEKYLAGEVPTLVEIARVPAGGRLLNDGVLGEMLIRTLLGPETDTAAAAGWGGDRFRVWDVSGSTLLVWRSVWDTSGDAQEFFRAALARHARSHGAPHALAGFTLYQKGRWSTAIALQGAGVVLIASDNARTLRAALQARRD